MNGSELFALMMQSSSVLELIQSGKTASKRGDIFEKLWDIIIKSGCDDSFPNDTYTHYEGNVGTCDLSEVIDLERYIKGLLVFSQAKGGQSDITMYNAKTGKWVFISCKLRLKGALNSVSKYDVQNIYASAMTHSHKYKSFDIYLFVADKQKMLKKIKASHTTSNYITDHIPSHRILDIAHAEIGFQLFKRNMAGKTINDVNSTFGHNKIPMSLRFHQELIVHKQMEQIAKGEKSLGLFAKARSGKTYCVGGLLDKYNKIYNTVNALIITPAPHETMTQFSDDVFHKFIEFTDIHVIEIKSGADLTGIDVQKNNLIIVSKQMLDGYVADAKIDAIHQLNLDFIVFDENHFHGTTQMSKDILQSYSSPKTVKLYLTATYAKPLNEWNIPIECQCYWDIEDEQLCKNRSIDGLVEKHGECVLQFLTEDNKEQMLGVYDNMPNLHILTNLMDRKRYDVIREKINGTVYGWSLAGAFSGKFPAEADSVLAFISGSDKERDYPTKDHSMYGRIRQLNVDHGSRTLLTNGDFTTQLWFLPYGKGMPISKVSEHVRDRMMKNRILQTFEVKIVNSKKEYNVKDIKKNIADWEAKAKYDGKSGLILLAGNQLTLGITLPYVDVVFLLNDIVASDRVVQMMYRCMTESTCSSDGTVHSQINTGQKKMGIVVDMNLSRVLNTCLEYNIHKKDLNTEQKLTYLVENNLINIDSDLFKGKENRTKLVEKLLHVWKSDPIHSLKTFMRKIEDTVIEMDTADQRLVNQQFTRSMGDTKEINVQILFDEESVEALPYGKEIITQCVGGDTESTESNESNESTESTESINNVVNVSITKDILPFILPLICILTLNTETNDILEMMDLVKKNPALLSVFREQSLVWWNHPDIIGLMEVIISKYIRKNSDIYNISIQFKMSLQSLIDNPKELLELIDSCLKPKQKEKQDNGEVFTPMCLVYEMLDNLDAYYRSEHEVSIFTDPSLTWFDPASGMGNFPVAVYLKLMEGLKLHFPNDNTRKKHIIENMLYMSEKNKKNVFITRQIFNLDNQYTMNLYEGDTLELDTTTVWGIGRHGFDVILGNPPYNKGGIRSHTGKQLGLTNETIWTKFIEKSFEWLKPDGFLVFINPLSWLKKSHSLHNKMLEKHIVWLKLWDNSQSKGMINADIPISLYVLQNKKNTTNKKTEITSVLKRRNLTTTSTEYLNPKYSIPLAFHNIFNKLVGFIETRNLQLEYKTKTIKSSGTKAKIPTEYTLEDMLAVDTYTIKEGLLVKKTLDQHPDANKRKLIISNKASFVGAFIDEGKLGLTGNDKSYIIGDNLELILKMLSFKISTIICHFTKYRQDFLEKEVYTYLPDIRKLGLDDITEDEFYKLIGLTCQEINQIKNPSAKGKGQSV